MPRPPIAIALATFSAAAPCQSAAEVEQQRLETLFAQRMSGCTMTGRFTVDDDATAPQTDRYTLGDVRKIRDEKWRVEAKIEYGEKSATVPLMVDVFWAGETPMIQVSDLAVPTLGVYSARVLIDGDRYAGTWSGKRHGGQMFGRIDSAPDEQAPKGNWPTWRGNEGTGEAPGAKPPVTWSEDENVVWKTPLPGLGNSTPVIWGDRIFLTTAVETEEKREAQTGADDSDRRGRRDRRRGRRGGGSALTNYYDFRVLAIDRDSGEVIWSKSAARAVPHERGHKTGSQASNSPVTDGRFVYAHFGSRGIHCFTLDGEPVWSRTDLGQMRTRNQFGEGSSPALVDDTLLVNWDHEGDSYLLALDARNGKDKWKQPRNEPTSWSTPVVVEVGRKKQVIVNATKASRAYDLKTGKVIWSCEGMTANTIPTPIVRDGVAYLMSGFRGAMLQAIRLEGAKGDITDSEHVLWTHERQTSYVPSALLLDDNIFFLRSNNAVLSCVNAETGEVRYEGQRLAGLRTIYASPVAADGRIYLTSREGATKVIKAGDEYEELATNELDDAFDASPILIGDRIYLRGHDNLYCLGKK